MSENYVVRTCAGEIYIGFVADKAEVHTWLLENIKVDFVSISGYSGLLGGEFVWRLSRNLNDVVFNDEAAASMFILRWL